MHQKQKFRTWFCIASFGTVSSDAMKLPEGWKVDMEARMPLVTFYPIKEQNIQEDYEQPRGEGKVPCLILLKRCISLEKTLSRWVFEKGFSTHFLIDQTGETVQWLPLSCKIQFAGDFYNDKALGVLIETPSEQEKINPDTLGFEEKRSPGQMVEATEDQKLNDHQLKALSLLAQELREQFPSLVQENNIVLMDDFYDAKRLENIVKCSPLVSNAYSLDRIANKLRLYNPFYRLSPLTKDIVASWDPTYRERKRSLVFSSPPSSRSSPEESSFQSSHPGFLNLFPNLSTSSPSSIPPPRTKPSVSPQEEAEDSPSPSPSPTPRNHLSFEEEEDIEELEALSPEMFNVFSNASSSPSQDPV